MSTSELTKRWIAEIWLRTQTSVETYFVPRRDVMCWECFVMIVLLVLFRNGGMIPMIRMIQSCHRCWAMAMALLTIIPFPHSLRLASVERGGSNGWPSSSDHGHLDSSCSAGTSFTVGHYDTGSTRGSQNWHRPGDPGGPDCVTPLVDD